MEVKKVEVLAPAGSFDIMKAVIRAGADAVYLGGDMFSARAFAGNLNKEELIEAIEYAHIFDRKIYLTVNTLLKQSEINEQLIEYIKPLYEAGLDAVIVQDLGVLKLIKQNFPDLDIHASTQMFITGEYGADIMKKSGVTRVVTAREMTLDEIKNLHEKVDVEIESFVHGALCYCYSGQCLLSSFNGTRSGNRGRCAQPCRMAYDAYSKDKKINSDKERYLISPKDMCALNILPDIIESGVYSLKIEGRMKNVTYAAFVTSMYRKYVDMYLSKGRKGFAVDPKDILYLMDIYNRGGFTSGYYNSKKGRDMISANRPNHMGVQALKIEENISGRITFKALTDINAGDVFEIDRDHSFESGNDVLEGNTFVVNLSRKLPLYKGRVLNRMNNNRLKQLVSDLYVNKELKLPVKFSLIAKNNQPLKLTVVYNEYCQEAVGQMVTQAKSHPATREDICKNLCKTGDTYFEVTNMNNDIDIDMDDDIFLPVGWIKEVRREALIKLENALRQRNKREYSIDFECNNLENIESTESTQLNPSKCIYLRKLNNVDYLAQRSDVMDIYLDFSLMKNEEELKRNIETIKTSAKKVYLVLPHVLEKEKYGIFSDMINKSNVLGFDGYICRNTEQLGLLASLIPGADVITDSGLYIFNSYAKEQLKELVRSTGLNLLRMTLPLELTRKELNPVLIDKTELVVYGNVPLMISKQCVKKTLGCCDKSNGVLKLKDGKDNEFKVRSVCEYCYSEMNGIPINITKEDLSFIQCERIRYEFENESLEEIKSILEGTYINGNTGHFFRGVD